MSNYKSNIEKFRSKGFSVKEAILLADEVEAEVSVPTTATVSVVQSGVKNRRHRASKTELTQEQAILAVINVSKTALTASEVQQQLAEVFPEINAKTVSTYLVGMSKKGLIRKLAGYGSGYSKV
jgi:predicted HTH transcriptional regulator